MFLGGEGGGNREKAKGKRKSLRKLSGSTVLPIDPLLNGRPNTPKNH